MVSRLERALGRALPRRLHRAAVEGSRWQYGALWPTLFATVAPRFLRLRSLGQAAIAGASLGAAVWTVGYAGWLPAAHLVPPLYRQRPTRSIASLLGHAAYGIGAVVPIYLIEQRLRRRRLLRRLFR